MHIYGLTGGTGSGKSEVARYFEAHGIPVIDADHVGHEMIARGGPAEADVVAAFGEGILSDGAIDRRKLGAIVFSDPAKLALLNQIVHPRLKAAVWERCAALGESGYPIVVVDAAIIADDGIIDPQLAGLILVACPESIRVQRLMAQRGFDEATARQRVRAQVPPESKRKLADWVVENTGTLQQLQHRVDILIEEMRRHAKDSAR